MNDTEFRASAFRLNYCADCGAKLGCDHADKRLSALWKMQILESRMHQSGKPDV